MIPGLKIYWFSYLSTSSFTYIVGHLYGKRDTVNKMDKYFFLWTYEVTLTRFTGVYVKKALEENKFGLYED